MLLGHKRKFPVAISKAREALKEQEEKKQREKEEQEEKKQREKEEQEEKKQREKEEQKEIREMDMELAKIDREKNLAKAKAKAKSIKEQQALVDIDNHPNVADKATTHSSAEVGSTETKVAKGQSTSIDLPANRSYAAFISHKKTHTKHGDSSETLAIRLKVFDLALLICELINPSF
jgi:hypothetical protein